MKSKANKNKVLAKIQGYIREDYIDFEKIWQEIENDGNFTYDELLPQIEIIAQSKYKL